MYPINMLGETGTDDLVCGTNPDPRCPARDAVIMAARPLLTVVLDSNDDVRVTHTAQVRRGLRSGTGTRTPSPQ